MSIYLKFVLKCYCCLLKAMVDYLLCCCIGYTNMNDYNGNHESGFIELLMEGDYKRHYNDGDDLNDGNYNDGDDSDNDSDDDDSNNDSDEEFYQLVVVICEAVVIYFNKYFNKTSCYDSEQTWWVWVRYCMEANKKLCYNMIGVKK